MRLKSECETAIRRLCQDWATETGFVRSSNAYASFSEFRRWAERQGYSSYFDFRSKTSALRDAEQWFDTEMNQNSRN